MAVNDGVSIQTSATRTTAANIRTEKNKMQTNFDNWTNIVRRLTLAENFSGKARDSFEQSYNTIKTTFDNYISLIESFASTLEGTTTGWEQQDEKLAAKAEELNDGN